MASFWDVLRADALLGELSQCDDTFMIGGDTPLGVGTLAKGSFGYSFVQKHFDAIKESLQLFGGWHLIVEGTATGDILIGVLDSNHESFLDSIPKIEAVRSQLQSYASHKLAESGFVRFENCLESYFRAAVEAFSAANGLETEAARQGRGGVGAMPSVPVEGMSAADGIRLAMTLQSMEECIPKPATPPVSQGKIALQDALARLTLSDVFSASTTNTDIFHLDAARTHLYKSLLALSGALGRHLVSLAEVRATAEERIISPTAATLMQDPIAFFAAVISHQRRYLSNPGALGPRVGFPISVFDLCLLYLSRDASVAMSDAFLDLRQRVEFPNEEADVHSAQQASYFTALRC